MSRLPSSPNAPLAVVVSLWCAPFALAQGTATVPAANLTIEGNTLDLEPFGYDRICFQHYAGADLLGGLPTGATISSVSYRRDFDSLPVATMQRQTARGQRVDPIWEVWMRDSIAGSVVNPPDTSDRLR